MIRACILALALGIPVLVPALAAAQLQATQWFETLSVQANNANDTVLGSMVAQPEALETSVIDGGAGSSSQVTFGSPGPPSGTATVSAFAELNETDLTAVANITINFFFRVVQTATPPVSVTDVPISVTATGSVEAGGSAHIMAQCLSDVTILRNQVVILDVSAAADNNPVSGAPTEAAFDETAVANVPVGSVMSGALIAQASIGGFDVDPGSASATAYVDPVIEVSPGLIPGTSESYRDYFDIEFGPGYFALGETPVQPTTWGDLKARYRD